MGILLLKLNEYRVAHAKNEMNIGLKHVTVLEEAHHLLPRVSTEQGAEASNIKGKAVEMLSNSIAEMRTYGEGFIIVDQSPNMLDLSAIRNTHTKIIMRLAEMEDRQDIGKSATLNDAQIDEIPKLERGGAVVYQNGWEEAILCKVEKSSIERSFEKKKKPFIFYPDKKLEVKKEIDTKIVEFIIVKIFYSQEKVDNIKKWLEDYSDKWFGFYPEDDLFNCLSDTKEKCSILRGVKILNVVLPVNELKQKLKTFVGGEDKTKYVKSFIKKHTHITEKQFILPLISLLKVASANEPRQVEKKLYRKINKIRRGM
jgi:DNA helicase HerA-like ATPase